MDLQKRITKLENILKQNGIAEVIPIEHTGAMMWGKGYCGFSSCGIDYPHYHNL